MSSAYLEIITLISSYWFHWYLVYPYPSRNGWAIQYSRPPPCICPWPFFLFFKFFDTQTGDGHTKCVSTFRLNITDFSRSMNSYLYSTFLYIKCIDLASPFPTGGYWFCWSSSSILILQPISCHSISHPPPFGVGTTTTTTTKSTWEILSH